MSTRLLASTVNRRVGFNAARSFPRLFHATALQSSNADTNKAMNTPNFANALSKKFIDQVRKERGERRVAISTRLVQITGLPITSTSEDLRKLARDAFPNGDQSIGELVFCRSSSFTFLGTCVILMDTPENARRLMSYGNNRLLGGNQIKLSFVGREGEDPQKYLSSVRPGPMESVMTSYSGHAVTISGFPNRMKPHSVLNYIRLRKFYPVEGTAKNMVELETKAMSTVSKFLVKFDSESEAWRCVRVFHNKEFPVEGHDRVYKLQVSVAY